MKKAAALLGGALLAAHGALAAQPDIWTLGSGLHYNSGDYGTGTTTTILSVPLDIRYERTPWRFRIWVPYVEIDGASSVIPGIGSVSNGNPRRRGGSAGASGAASGLGDVVASATYAAHYDPTARLGVDVTGKIKLGTADADAGLGTGEHDFAALAEAFKTFDRTTFFAGVGHHWLGSSPLLRLDDVWSWSLGASYRIDQRDSAGVFYDSRERVSSSAEPLSEITAFWSRRLDRAWKAQAYFLLGLAEGSPDWGTGLSVAYAF
jgi:hypothetical protein